VEGSQPFLAVSLFDPPNRIATDTEPLGDLRLADSFGPKQKDCRPAGDAVLRLAGPKVGLQDLEVFGLQNELSGVASHVPLLSL
jgi:hypothetical protein